MVKFCFQKLLEFKNIHHYSGSTDKGPLIAERVIRFLRKLLKKPVFEKRNSDRLSDLPSGITKYNNTIHHSIKITPLEASLKKNENLVYSNL